MIVIVILITCVLTWQDNTGSANQTSTFAIERSRAGGAFGEIGRATFWYPGPQQYTDTDAQNNDSYRVAAINYIGQSGYSNIATCVQIAPAVPGPMVNLTVAYSDNITVPQDLRSAKASATSILITWGLITDPYVDFVHVQWSDNGGANWYGGTGELPRTAVQYTHAGLPSGTYLHRLLVFHRTTPSNPTLLGTSNQSQPVTI